MNTYLAGLLMVSSVAFVHTRLQGKIHEHYIDLLTARTVQIDNPVPVGRRLTIQQPLMSSSHSEKPHPALAVLSPVLDRSVYKWGEPFICEWVIENRSKQAVKFPTLTADDQIDRDMPGASVATIALRFTDEQLAGEVVAVHALFGADSVPGSLIVVAPGDRVRIRGSGKWSLMGVSKSVINASQHEYQVKATIRTARNGRADLAVQSEASVPVSVGK